MDGCVLEIEQYEGKFYWKVKTLVLGRLLKQGQASRLANAKLACETAYKEATS